MFEPCTVAPDTRSRVPPGAPYLRGPAARPSCHSYAAARVTAAVTRELAARRPAYRYAPRRSGTGWPRTPPDPLRRATGAAADHGECATVRRSACTRGPGGVTF